MTTDDRQSHSLRRLRDCIESNLSRLVGPHVAREMVSAITDDKSTEDVHYLTSRLAVYCARLTAVSGELDSLRRYHRDSLNTLPMAACAIDYHSANQEVMLWNQAMTGLTGITANKAIGRSLSAIAAPWNTILGDFLQHSEQHLNRHTVDVAGTAHYFSLHKASGQAGDKSQVILLEDQTETRLLEEQLLHSERLASIGQLAAGVAHEIGNPIMGIDMLAQELISGASDPGICDQARLIREQTEQVRRIVQSLVSYARHRHSAQPRDHLPDAEPVEIRVIVQESITLLQLSHKNSNIVFRNLCAGGLYVSGDRQKLQQVFINLLKNAADASDSSDPTSVICTSTSAKSDKVTVYVEDQGHGIPGSVQKKMYEPFFTTKEAGQGTGLGLALTWSIIEEHAGTIEVVSPLNLTTHRGTRFIISLPRAAAAANTTEPIMTQEEMA